MPACAGTCRRHSRRSTTRCRWRPSRMSAASRVWETAGLYSACRFFTPARTGVRCRSSRSSPAGTAATTPTGTTSRRTSGSRGGRVSRRDGFARCSAIPEQATIRGGYSVAYERQGFGVFTGVFGPNPGSTLSLTRDANTGLVPAGESWPVLLRETNRLYPAPFPESPTFPIAPRANRADDILNAFHPDIEIASARSWTIGFQRAISSSMAVEARYVGTRGVNQWSTLNYNELNILENGFYDEFMLAMANFQANNAAGGTRTLVRVLWAWAADVAAADRISPISTRAATRTMRRPTPARRGRAPGSPGTWAGRILSRSIPPLISTATSPAATQRAPPVWPRTFSSSIHTSTMST